MTQNDVAGLLQCLRENGILVAGCFETLIFFSIEGEMPGAISTRSARKACIAELLSGLEM